MQSFFVKSVLIWLVYDSRRIILSIKIRVYALIDLSTVLSYCECQN